MSVQVWVSGATGFVGRHLVRRLLSEGLRVICLVRSRGEVARELESLGAELVVGDLADIAPFEQSLHGVDTLYHLAAAYRDGATRHDTFVHVNVEATESLVGLAARFGVRRFVYCSTVGVHGDCQTIQDETGLCAPHEAYGLSKLEAERRVNAGHRDLGLETVVVRPVGVYGPGDWRLTKLFKGIAQGRFLLIGPGRNRYHMTYIDDLIEGLWLASRVAEANGQTYIIGGNDVPTVHELCQTIAKALGRRLPSYRLPFWPIYLLALICEGLCRPLGVSPPLFRRRLDFFSKSRWFDISKAQRELGFVPRVGLGEGVARTIAWYRERGILPKGR